MRKTALLFACLLLLLPSTVLAQNTSSVFSPGVDEGEQGWEYRASFDADSDGLNQRLHYQRAINGALRWRLIGQLRKTDDSTFDPDYLRGELDWQVTPDEQPYQSGFRFEFRHRFEERPKDITVHWINQWRGFEGWTLRAIFGASREFGDNNAEGILVESRLSAYTSLPVGPGLGVETYSDYGSTTDWLPTDQQSHQIGPFANWSLGEGWTLFTGALFGLTEGTPDQQFRVHLVWEY